MIVYSNMFQKLFWSVLIVLVCPLFCSSQEPIYDVWQVKDGLPQNTINMIEQTKDGYIWIATEGGLSRFDCVRFENFDVTSTPELGSNRITYLHVAKNGDLLIGTYNGGLIIMHDGVFENRTDLFRGNRYTIREIVESDSLLFFSNTENDSLDVVNSENYDNHRVIGPIDKNTRVSIFAHNGNLYLPSWDNILMMNFGLNDHTKSLVYVADKRIEAIVPDEENNVYWLIDNGDLLMMQHDAIKKQYPIPRRDEFSDYPMFMIMADQSIYFYFYGASELMTFDREKEAFGSIIIDEFCENGSINDVFADAENNIWLATDICGLVKLRPDRFSYLGTSENPLIENVYPINRDSKGNFWIGTRQEGIFILNEENQYVDVPLDPRQQEGMVTSIEALGDEVYYALVARNHIFKWKDYSIEKIYFADGKRRQVNALFNDEKGSLLLGTETGIYELREDSLFLHHISQLASAGNVHNLFRDSHGVLWAVSDTKILAYDMDENLLKFSWISPEGAFRYFRGITEDENGYVYIGSYGHGFFVIKDDSLHQISTLQGLKENVVSTITFDSSGYTWLTGNIGLSRIKKDDLFGVLNGERSSVEVMLYNEQTDRLRTGEFNGGFQQDKLHIEKDIYVFPTMRGALKVNFAEMEYNDVEPPVLIEEFWYQDSTYTSISNVTLPFSEGRLEIAYTANSFVSPDLVKFKYKMEGYDKDWQEGGIERKTSYTKLPPGEYTFKVIAANNEGLWNYRGDQLQISITPPFYLTWWFRVLSVLLLIALTALIVWQAVARYRKNERHKSALMDLLPDFVLKVNADGTPLDLYGRPSDLPESFDHLHLPEKGTLFPQKLRDEAMHKIRKAIDTGQMQELTYSFSENGNQERHFESRFIAVNKKEVLCIIRDVTRSRVAEIQIRKNEKKLLQAVQVEKKLLKKLNDQQKLQLEAIVNTEEKERMRIAKDLHDGIGQLISSIKLNLGAALSKLQRSDLTTAEDLIDKSNESINRIAQELRNISYNLLPPSLEQFGLASAIEEEVDRLRDQSDVYVNFDYATTNVKFDQKIELMLFRVFQELLNNALRHAKAREITIQLIEHERDLMLMVEDDGVGFSLNRASNKKFSGGLKNIQSRIELIKGELKIDSGQESGTTVTVVIPLK
jgi:signal transduction histidine kinase/ligand-binding sensor domain-containing protein